MMQNDSITLGRDRRNSAYKEHGQKPLHHPFILATALGVPRY